MQNALDGRIFIGRGELGLEDDAKRPVTNNLALRVLYLSCFSCDAVLNLLANDLCILYSVSSQPRACPGITATLGCGGYNDSPPILRVLSIAGRFDAMLEVEKVTLASSGATVQGSQ